MEFLKQRKTRSHLHDNPKTVKPIKKWHLPLFAMKFKQSIYHVLKQITMVMFPILIDHLF